MAQFLYKAIRSLCVTMKEKGIFSDFATDLIASSDLGKGSGEYERMNYDEAYSVLRAYENLNDDHAYGLIKYQLALMYYHGHGVKQDYDRFKNLIIQSANLGCDWAQKYLSDGNIR